MRRWDIRRVWLRCGVIGGGVALAGWFLTLGGLYHYWKAYHSTQSIRIQNASYDQERAMLLAKMSELQQVVERTERLTKRLEVENGVQTKEMQRGIGPITEETELPAVPIMSELRQFKLGGKTGKNSKDQFAFNDLQMDVNTLQGAASKIEERLHKVYEVRQEKRSFW
ncbi:MAG: hypothetical protein HY543_07920, partial [Deltaproteobacteria bacterium]|nr:hypothetical protein [Deltaproteobacteria bacterium]